MAGLLFLFCFALYCSGMNWFCSIYPPPQVVGVVFVELPIGSLQIGSQEEDVRVLYNSFTQYNLLYNGFRNVNMSAVLHAAHSHYNFPVILALRETQLGYCHSQTVTFSLHTSYLAKYYKI